MREVFIHRGLDIWTPTHLSPQNVFVSQLTSSALATTTAAHTDVSGSASMPVVPNASVERYSTGYSHLTDPIAPHTPITAIQRLRRCLLAARQRSRCGKTSRRDGPVHVLRRVLWTSGHCRGSRVWSAFDLRCASCLSRGGFGVVSVWPKGRHHAGMRASERVQLQRDLAFVHRSWSSACTRDHGLFVVEFCDILPVNERTPTLPASAYFNYSHPL